MEDPRIDYDDSVIKNQNINKKNKKMMDDDDDDEENDIEMEENDIKNQKSDSKQQQQQQPNQGNKTEEMTVQTKSEENNNSKHIKKEKNEPNLANRAISYIADLLNDECVEVRTLGLNYLREIMIFGKDYLIGIGDDFLPLVRIMCRDSKQMTRLNAYETLRYMTLQNTNIFYKCIQGLIGNILRYVKDSIFIFHTIGCVCNKHGRLFENVLPLLIAKTMNQNIFIDLKNDDNHIIIIDNNNSNNNNNSSNQQKQEIQQEIDKTQNKNKNNNPNLLQINQLSAHFNWSVQNLSHLALAVGISTQSYLLFFFHFL